MKISVRVLLLCTLATSTICNGSFKEFIDSLTAITQSATEFNKANWRALRPEDPAAATRSRQGSELFGLDDLVGSHPVAIDDIVDILRNREQRKAQGIELPHGILFWGPAGTGKTSYAKAIAHDLGFNYLEVSASDFEEVFVGLGASRIRELFTKARKQQPCVIVIDEVDALGTRDSVLGNSLSRQLIDALLAEMDGIHSQGDVIVIGTTNELHLVDKALRRPGRFDYVVEIALPNEDSRKEIVLHYLNKRAHADHLELSTIARQTRGFSGAELKEIVKRAVVSMVKNKRTMITQEDLDEGFKQLMKEKSSRS